MSLEITTEAIVLGKEDAGEYDSRIFLYTKDFGKLSAKATSARKITSKLAAHIEPLLHTTIRLVSRGDAFEGRGFQLTDALTEHPSSKGDQAEVRSALAIAEAAKSLIPDAVPDQETWSMLRDVCDLKNHMSVRELLRFFGFDPEFSACEFCSAAPPQYFLPKNHFFSCRTCVLNLQIGRKELIEVR